MTARPGAWYSAVGSNVGGIVLLFGLDLATEVGWRKTLNHLMILTIAVVLPMTALVLTFCHPSSVHSDTSAADPGAGGQPRNAGHRFGSFCGWPLAWHLASCNLIWELSFVTSD